jgi:hypothetical protein
MNMMDLAMSTISIASLAEATISSTDILGNPAITLAPAFLGKKSIQRPWQRVKFGKVVNH